MFKVELSEGNLVYSEPKLLGRRSNCVAMTRPWQQVLDLFIRWFQGENHRPAGRTFWWPSPSSLMYFFLFGNIVYHWGILKPSQNEHDKWNEKRNNWEESPKDKQNQVCDFAQILFRLFCPENLRPKEQLPERLSTGAVVEELQLVGERLQYQLRSGEGPKTGWVSISLKDKAPHGAAVGSLGPKWAWHKTGKRCAGAIGIF